MSTTPTPLTRVLRWLRGPWVAPDPAPDLSWLDRADGLDTRRPLTMHVGRCGPDALTDIQVLGRDRYSRCDETCTADCGHCKGRRFGPYAIPHPTRYDVQWPSVLAAEAPGGDLAAMAAPLPGMARDDLGTYAEPVTVLIEADVSRFRDEMAHAARKVAELTEPVKPRGRHRQTDPLDLILADLRDLDGRP